MVKLSYFFSWFYIALSERVTCNTNDELVVWTSMVRDITTKRYGRIANGIRVQLDSITSKWFEIVMNYHFSNLASQPPCQGLPKSCCRRKSNSTSSCLLLHCLCSSSVGGGVLVVCDMNRWICAVPCRLPKAKRVQRGFKVFSSIFKSTQADVYYIGIDE